MSIKYNIFFRACDKVESVHKDKRPFGLNKLEIIKVPLFSPIDSAIFGLYKDFNLHEVVDSLTV